ncbi:hypothetical protein FRACYDRAFT_235421 [Fragilariopsis cylindrus CCMP1102]|uniref:Uncharacterized protein n=1 Tax=Fragilariopsis cylindrus CCMP1102 TaxID=635003 RepID=A0A1E7FMI4_9STRA|nr:hypothetical protein FRACYDRAFT_235421 [Fragilariopsis cylindrus CCMP1102]|eukprot:OEU19371.1 hypothetical protein FRACYDRAFT_235421 [Fragilariopsis cylindrus CCMP1102]
MMLDDDDDDCRTHEVRKELYSHKSHGAALTYELAIDDDDVQRLIPRAMAMMHLNNQDATESDDDDNDDSVPDPASSATVPGASTGETLAGEGAGEDSSVWVAGSNENELGPLSYFDPDVLRVTRKVMHLQVDQKKVELRNLGMEVPDDLTILKGLDTWSLFGFSNEALEKDPATNLFYQQL